MPAFSKKVIAIVLLSMAASAHPACSRSSSAPAVDPDESKLAAATDIFWTLQNLGFMVVKEKPVSTKHGCKPAEFIAQKGPAKAIESRFRISVFECPTAQRAEEIVRNAYTRKVDSLLRNHHDGGVVRRNSMEIIIRREKGSDKAADALLLSIEGM